MQDIPEMYIRGLPIDTKIGKCCFITMAQYEEIYKFQKLLFFTKEDLYDILDEILNVDKDEILENIRIEYREQLNNFQIIELIKGFKELKYYDMYKSVFDYFIGENIFDNLINSDKDLLIYKIQVMGKLKELLNEKNIIKNDDSKKEKSKDLFVNIIKNIRQLQLYKAYTELFDFCFKEDKNVFNKISTDEELEYYIQLIINMNLISKPNEDELNNKELDPEIKKFNMYDKLIQESKQGDITFKSMYASLWLALQKQPEFLTIYQYNTLFEQLGQFKSFDATTNGYCSEIVMWCADSKKTKKENKIVDNIEDEMIDKAINNMEKVVGDIS